MKNILAENMLRFGVKNLSESDLRKLQEAEPTPTGATAAATTPGAKPAGQPERRKFESTWNANQQGTIVPAKVVGSAEKQPDGSFKPLDIIMTYPKASSGNSFISFKPIEGVYKAAGDFSKMANIKNLVQENAGIAKGPIPATALKDVISQISKFTKKPLSLDPAVFDALAFPWWKSAVGKSINQPITTGILKPWGQAFLSIKYHPETGAELHRELWIGGTNQYSFAKGANGKLAYNAAVSNYDGMLKKLGMAGTAAERQQILDAATIIFDQLNAKG